MVGDGSGAAFGSSLTAHAQDFQHRFKAENVGVHPEAGDQALRYLREAPSPNEGIPVATDFLKVFQG
jgi:hypothetical protein